MEFSAGQTVRSGWCPFSAAACVCLQMCACVYEHVVCPAPSCCISSLSGDSGSVDALNFLFPLGMFFPLFCL